MIDTGMPWLSSKMAEKRSAASIVWRPARLAWWSQLEHQLRRGRDAHVAAGEGRHHVQVLFKCLEDGVRIELEIAHHLREQIPFDLGKRQEDVLVPEDGMVAPARFLYRAVDNPLR